MSGPAAFTPAELAECAEREVKQRARVYPRWVAAGRMTQALADRQFLMMRAIAEKLRAEANASPGAGDLFGGRAVKVENRRSAPASKGLAAALVQLEALMRRLGMIPVEVEVVRWELHHDPELALRDVDQATGQHIPHQHDPKFMAWLPETTHRVITNGNGATTAGSSKGEIRKTRQLVKARIARGEVERDDPSISRWAPKVDARCQPARPIQGRGLPGKANKPSPCRTPEKLLALKERRP